MPEPAPRENLCRDLDQKPRNYGVSDRNLVNIAPFQFGEEIARVHGVALFSREFRRKIIDDFFEVRITSQLIPVRESTAKRKSRRQNH
jgi:hypothetical protein